MEAEVSGKDLDSSSSAARALASSGPGAVEPLAGRCGDPRAQVRSAACISLSRLAASSSEAIAALKRCVRDGDDTVQRAACLALAEAGVDVAAELASILKGDAPQWDLVDRSRELALLAEMGPAAASAVPTLVEAIRSGGPVLMATKDSLATLGTIGPTGDRLIALWQIGPAAAPLVPAVLEARKRAAERAQEFIETQSPEAGAVFPLVRWETILSFLAPLGQAAVPHILAQLETAQGDERWLLARALDATVGPESEEAVPALSALAGGSEEGPIYWAASALSKIGPKAGGAVPALRRALASSSPTDRAKAARALGSIGPAALPAAEDLRQLLKDEDPLVSIWGAYGLGALGIEKAEMISRLTRELVEPSVSRGMEAAEALGRLLGLEGLRLSWYLWREDTGYVDRVRAEAVASVLEAGTPGQEALVSEMEALLWRLDNPAQDGPGGGGKAKALNDLVEILEVVVPRVASWPEVLLPRLRGVFVKALAHGRYQWDLAAVLVDAIGLGNLSARELLARWPRRETWKAGQWRAMARVPGGDAVLRETVRSAAEESVRVAAIRAMSACRGESARATVAFLVELLEDPSEQVRCAAAETIEEMGPDAREAFEPLLEAWRKRDGPDGDRALRASRQVVRFTPSANPWQRGGGRN